MIDNVIKSNLFLLDIYYILVDNHGSLTFTEVDGGFGLAVWTGALDPFVISRRALVQETRRNKFDILEWYNAFYAVTQKQR